MALEKTLFSFLLRKMVINVDTNIFFNFLIKNIELANDKYFLKFGIF